MYLYSLQTAVLTNLNGCHEKTELLSVFYKFVTEMMPQIMDIPFVKYHGAGNDFVIIDNMKGNIALSQTEIAFICHRRFGVGADGLMLVEKSNEAAFYMRYFNSDGNESTMCGNGGRCISHYAHTLKLTGESISFVGIDGPHSATIVAPNRIKLKMKDVTGFVKADGYTFLDTGSPHHVIFRSGVNDIDVVSEGKAIRYSAVYPTGTNVDFVEEMGNNKLFVRTYERGVEDETLSCGTGVVASAIAAFIKGNKSEHFAIEARGGSLEVSFNHQKGEFFDVYLTGPVKFVFEGKIAV